MHLDDDNKDKGVGSGGSADIYQDTKQKQVYLLTYRKGCNGTTTEGTLFFIDNKIVLAIIPDARRNISIYYQHDNYLCADNLNVVTEKFANQVL